MKRILLSFVLLFIAGALFAQTIPVTDLNGVAVGVDTTTSFTEDAGPVLIAQNALVDDPDAAGTILSMTITVTNDLDGIADTLYLNAAATTAASGASITVTAYNDATGALVLSGSSLEINYQSVLQGVQYENLSDAPTETDRSITVVVTDLDGSSVATTSTVSVSGVNDTPATDLNGAPVGVDTTTAFTEDGGAVLIAENALVSDVDSGDDIESMTITVTNDLDGVADTLYLNGAATTAASGASITVTPYNDGTGVLAFSGTATPAEYESVLQGVQYENLSDNPTETDRAITVVVNDGTVPSVTTTSTVSVTAANDPPVTDLNGAPVGVDTTTAFTEDGGAVLIAENALVSDVDTGDDIESMTITVTNDLDGVADTLYLNGAATTAASGASITVTPYDDGTGILAFSGAATPAEYQSVLQGVQYENLSDNPTETDRAITVVVNDGDDPSVSTTSTVSVTAVNDVPEIANLGGDAFTYTGGSGAQILDQSTAAVLSDAESAADFDGGNLSVTIPVGKQAAEDFLSFDGGVVIDGLSSGSNVIISGVTVGTIDNNLAVGEDLIVTLNSDATIPRVQTLIRAITYTNTDPLTPTTGARTVRVTVDDNDGPPSTSINYDVTVTVAPPAGPTLDSVAWVGDGSGNITGLYVEFSEDVDIVDGNGATAGFDAFSFSAGGYTFDDTDYTTSSAVSNLTFTLATPIMGTAGPVADLIYDDANTSSIISDATAQEMDDLEQEAIDDAAEPVMIAASTYDHDGNGQIDSLAITFSEIIDQSTIASNGGDFTIGSSYAATAADTDTGADDIDVYVLLTEKTTPDTDATPSITLSATPTFTDANGIAALASDNITPADGAAPVIVSAVTDDINADGFIETVVLTFSEPIDDDAAGSDLDLIDVDGYSGESPDSDNDDDDEVTITFTPQSSPNYDTDATPNIILPIGAVEDGFDNAVSAIQTFTGTEDGADPSLIDLVIGTGNTYIEARFSEDIYGTGTGGAIAIADFTYNTTGDALATVTSITDLDDVALSGPEDTVRFALSFSPKQADGGDELDISPIASTVEDITGNNYLSDDIESGVFPTVSAVTFNSYSVIANNDTLYLEFSRAVDRENGTAANKTAPIRISDELRLKPGSFNDPDGGVTGFSLTGIRDSLNATLTENGRGYVGVKIGLTFTGTPSGNETFEMEPSGTNQIRASDDNVSMLATEEITITLIDELAPTFIDSSYASTPSVGVGQIFGGSEVTTITVDWDEAGLTVTGDFTDLHGIYGASEPFNDIGGGLYTFNLFPATFLNNGTRTFSVTATDMSVNANSTTVTDFEIDMDSETFVTNNQLFTADDNSSAPSGITLTGTTDDNADILDVTIDGSTYESDGAAAAAFTLGGGVWSLDLFVAGAGTLTPGAYDIDISSRDDEGNTFSDTFENGLVITDGVTVTAGLFGDACLDREYVTMTNDIVITEDQGPDISAGIAQTIRVLFPAGFEFTISDLPTPAISVGGTGFSNPSYDSIAPNLLEIIFDASDASLDEINSITISNLSVRTTSAASIGTSDITYQIGTATIQGLAADSDLGDVSYVVPSRPNSGTAVNVEYCDEATFVVGDIAAVNSANHIWYDDLDDVYKSSIHTGAVAAAGDINLDMSTPAVYTYYVTNTAGGSCESMPTTVTITINPNPVVDAGTDLTGGLAVCSKEDILLGGSPTLTTTTTGPYTYVWTSNVGSVAAFSDDELTGQTAAPNPNIPAPTNTNAYPGADATLRYTLNITDGNSCSGSDFIDVQVHPAINPTLALDPAGGTYTETSIPVELVVTPAAEDPFNEGIFSGAGIVYNDDASAMYYEFRPQDVGDGIYPIAYTFTDAITGCQESVSTSVTVTSGAAGSTFDNLPNADGGVDAGVCVNETPFTIKLNATDATFLDGIGPDPRYEAINIKYPDFTTNMARVSGAIGDFDSNDEYTYDPALAIANGGSFGENTIVIELRQYDGNPVVTSTNDFFWVSQQTKIYPLPDLGIFIEDEATLNFTDNIYDPVEQNYCEDGGNLVFTATVSNQETASGSYRIRRVAPSGTALTAFGGTIDLADPLSDASFMQGQYEVEFVNLAADDAAAFGGSGCTDTTTVQFNIRATPVAYELDLGGTAKGVDRFDADPNLSTEPGSAVDYIFRYCESETSFETLRVAGVGPDERVNWYDENLTLLGTSTANGSKISGSELFQTASAFPPDPGVYTFGYTVTDYIGASAGFEGCEGDFTIVQIDVYPDVVNPPIDLTYSARGEDKSSGSEENYFVYEYCYGETIEGLTVVHDSLLEDFDSGVPSGWSGVLTGASPSGAALAEGGTGNAIRLETDDTDNELISAEYQSIQHVSFDYRTDGVATGASFVVEVRGAEATYQIGSLVANSNGYQTFEADILGSLTDADVRIYIDVTGDVDLIIDNFSVSSTIPNKTFYQWSYHDGGSIVLIDGAIDGSDDQAGAGVVTTQGNDSITSDQLIAIIGTDPPPAGTYTFYVNKVENINGTDSPNFDGCEGETTQIDIVVYPIPAAPTGFDTDINAHSGELNINTRISSTDLVDVPGSANVDYIWSATNAIGATDSINSLTSFPTGTINNADLTYGQLLSNLSSPIADPSGYYTVSSTYNGSAYLFQVTNELNRQTSVFPGCGSATGTQVDFTIYPLAEKPILSDTNDISKTNLFFDDNSTGGDLTDDIGENLELNFCAGDLAALDSISIVSRYLSSNDREFTWYRSNIAGTKLQEINIGDADGSFATASELFLTGINNDLTTYYLVTQTTDIESGTYDGGESDSVRLKVNIYNIPSAPESAIAGDSTEFYYCFGEPIRDLVVEGESPAQFYWYASEADAQAGTNRLNGGSPTTTLTAALMDPDENGLADLTGTPVAGTYTFYATQVTDFSVTPETDFVSPSFVGCEGQPIEFTIYVRSIPQLPDVSFMEQFLCETENASPFSITNRATGALVTWYEDNQTTIRKSAEQNSFDPDDVGDGGIVLPLDITTRFYVGQRTDSLFNGSEFIGCISPLEYVEVTQFEKPLTPTVTYEGTSSNPATPTTIFEAGVCEGSTDSALELQVSSTQESPAYFKWYSTDASGVINQLVFTTGQIAGNAPITVTGADLNLETATEGVRYFKVAQVAEFADFDGCETVTANMQRVQINIFRSPAFPTFSVADNDAFSTTNNTTQFYLVYDSTGMSLYNDQLKNDVFTATGTNTAGVPGALTNTAPQEYNWYYNSSLELADDPTADFDDLNMTSILPRDNGGFNNPTTIETYSYEVRQGQFRGQNANPEACESPSQFVDVNIIPIPDTPTPVEVLVELCEDETVGSLSITNRAPGAQVHWFNEDPRVNPNADTLNSIADFTYVPTEVQGNDGTYTYYVRQVTNVEIGGTNFQGAVSDVAIVTVTVYPNAGVPESTAENNRYVYCIGERIENLQVDNPETGVTYAWYGDINLNSFLGNTTSNNNNLIPSLNGAFDENTVGTYNYYVTSTLAGQGCESSPTLVQVIINGLPDPEIKFDTGIAFENEEDVPEFYQMCVDESPLSIIGSSEGSSFGTFTGDGVVQGTNGRATFDPLLALGIADPLDMPEFGIDTIMVNYNLANSNDCDDNFQVGFVVTALPRPNFEASISSPINVPVLIEDEDLGVACVDVDPNNLATVTRLTLRASGGRRTGEFIISNALRDTTLAIANGSVEFDLDLWSNPSRTQDTLFIRYVFADAFGCSYFKDKKIVLHENPMVEFENIVGCIGEPATFTARALAPFTNDDIEFWDWTLINNQTGQIAETTSFADGSQSIVTTISDPSTYRVSVRGRSAKYEPINNLATCVSIDESTTNSTTPDVDEERDEVGNTQLVPIGDFPEVDFSWRFITENEVTTVEGKETDLEDLKDVNGDPLNGVSQVWMDWGDGSALDTLLANEGIGKAFGFEEHTYTSDGWYDAKLKVSTVNGCVDSVTKVIKILPHIVVDPAIGIINNFEVVSQSEAGWFVDETEMGSVADKTTSWTYGPIDSSIAQNGFAGSQGWGTDEGGAGYQEDDGSWVFSPSYDISAFEKPMVVFKGHYEFAQNDGAIMEYSINNGASWNILGRHISGDEEGTGIYWYGTLDIRADPGDQRSEGNLANASGWGFPSAMIDNQDEGFVSSIRHKLDEIPVNGRQNVRFRFHFAATSANSAPGIVFDDFEIVERGRISLIEQFSNSNSNQDRGGFVQGQYTSLALNNEVNARLDSTLLNNNDLVAVNYYTEIYGNDPLFEVNEEGPSARTLFYGLNNVTSILDGDVLEGTNLSTEAASPPWSGAESNRNTLRDAEFDLQLVLNSSDNDEISVTVEVTPQKDFVGNDIRVYLAVVEKVLTGEVLPNGEFDPRNVFRKFLPSPLGHEVNDLNEGSVTTLTETWKIDARKVLDPDQLAIVAFVQKANGDREVYQAARVDINGKTSILGVGDLIEVDDLNLYPNPANDAFFVTFDLTLEEDFQWRLFDQTGRLMKNGQVFKGMDGFRVESAGLPSGLYLMSIGNETKQYTHLKVIVKH